MRLTALTVNLAEKENSLKADPEHNFMFMGPGMIEFFKHVKEELLKEGVDEAAFANMFSGIKGIRAFGYLWQHRKMQRRVGKIGHWASDF